MRAVSSILALLVLAAASPLLAYTIYLTDGSTLMAKEPFTVEGGKAIITLPNGTRTSIDADEIDVERTRQANRDAYGATLILEDRYTDISTEEPPPESRSLSDMIAERETGAATRPPSRRPEPAPTAPPAPSAGGPALEELPRSPFHHDELAAEVQRVFGAQGVADVRVSQGTSSARLLVDVTADSEATVFRSLDVAANALLHVRDSFPDVPVAFELLLTTTDGAPAGEFLMDEAEAERLAGGEIETSTYFIQNVRF